MQEYLLKAQKTDKFIRPLAGRLNNGGSKRGVSPKPDAAAVNSGANGDNRKYSTIPDVFRTVRNYVITGEGKLQYKSAQPKANVCITLMMDASGSMLHDKQIAAVKGIIERTIEEHSRKRIRYAVVALSKGTASVLMHPSLDNERLMEVIDRLPAGGRTNMKEGFKQVAALMKDTSGQRAVQHLLYIFTDGRINCGDTQEPFEEAVAAYKVLLRSVKQTVVVDTEQGFVKLGMAAKLAEKMNVRVLSAG